jgi:hypothetical protein
MVKPHYILKETFDLDDNQYKLIVLAILTFIFQAAVFYVLDPNNFKYKWAILCFFTLFAYNIAYYKFFLN